MADGPKKPYRKTGGKHVGRPLQGKRPKNTPAPWHRQQKKRPVKTRLQYWRSRADVLAREAGGRWSCNLCKRPIGDAKTQTGGFHRVFWRKPGRPGKSSGKWRKMCFACWTKLDLWIEEQEINGTCENLPPEVLSNYYDYD